MISELDNFYYSVHSLAKTEHGKFFSAFKRELREVVKMKVTFA